MIKKGEGEYVWSNGKKYFDSIGKKEVNMEKENFSFLQEHLEKRNIK